MKTILSTNSKRNSFKLDIIDKDKIVSFDYEDLKDAIDHEKYVLSTDNKIEYYALVKAYQN